jgi:hypothetical protein
VGIEAVRLGPLLWRRIGVFNFEGSSQTFEENFFLGRVDAFEPFGHSNLDGNEMISDTRWWTLDEVSASFDMFAPRRLGALLRPVLAGNLPLKPVQLDFSENE